MWASMTQKEDAQVQIKNVALIYIANEDISETHLRRINSLRDPKLSVEALARCFRELNTSGCEPNGRRASARSTGLSPEAVTVKATVLTRRRGRQDVLRSTANLVLQSRL